MRSGANRERSPYPIPAALNLTILLLQLGALGAIFYGASRAEHAGHVLGLALAFAVVGNSMYAIVHEAEHRTLHPDRRVNDALGVLMALFFPAPFHLLRQGHLGHHMRNRSDDEAFDFYFPGESAVWKRIQLYGTITGFYWLVIVLSNLVVVLAPSALTRGNFRFDRPSMAFMDSLNPVYWTAIRLEALGAIALHASIVLGLGIPPLRYACVYLGFGVSWSAMQYVHHFGTERHVLRGARNLWVFAPLDLLWLHHNWHLTHHRHPTVPWTHLPRLGREEDPRREFLLLHYLRMWRGPRRGTERVENRYAGRIIK